MRTIFMPKKIKVGYQTRNDTYTKKLAYVIYYDEKGILRKENSWRSWIDKNIKDDEFENISLEGFVLNKKVGDYNLGNFETRHAYIRVYDPRGFEIEITVNNLLYILENCNCIKGKGLEGKFCYGWNGTDLILLPENSLLYKESEKYTNSIFNPEKIKSKELKIGKIYTLKNNYKYVYLGQYKNYFKHYKDFSTYVDKKIHYYLSVEKIDKLLQNKDYSFYLDSGSSFKPISDCEEFIDSDVLSELIKIVEENVGVNFTGNARIYYSLKELKEKLSDKNIQSFSAWNDGDLIQYDIINRYNDLIEVEYRHKTYYNSYVLVNGFLDNIFNELYYSGIFENGKLVKTFNEIILNKEKGYEN